ncbi:MAG: hypothetical protein LBO66_07620 [Deltaproteobacteria bacterium]|jgi:hypothetical protein|nr:hypothetical protein [Deltaproteobacteria bacterium]
MSAKSVKKAQISGQESSPERGEIALLSVDGDFLPEVFLDINDATKAVIGTWETATLVDKAAELKRVEKIVIDNRHAMEAEFLGRTRGQRKFPGLRYLAKISVRNERDYKQTVIEELRGKIPEAEFQKLFTWDWKGISKKVIDEAVMESPHSALILETFEDKAPKASVTYQPMEEN